MKPTNGNGIGGRKARRLWRLWSVWEGERVFCTAHRRMSRVKLRHWIAGGGPQVNVLRCGHVFDVEGRPMGVAA